VKSTLTAALLLIVTALAYAQEHEGPNDRFMIAGSAGWFRISHDDFSGLYGDRAGLVYGAAAVAKIRSPYNLVVKYRSFQKANDVIVNDVPAEVSWDQNWINVGVRYVSFGRQPVTSFFGFGLAFFKIDESGPRGILSPEGGERSATGFFLDGGLDFRFTQRTSIFFEIEISSAAVGGRGGFEGSSVGGYYLELGLNLFVL
jgi:hypothetical protein